MFALASSGFSILHVVMSELYPPDRISSRLRGQFMGKERQQYNAFITRTADGMRI